MSTKAGTIATWIYGGTGRMGKELAESFGAEKGVYKVVGISGRKFHEPSKLAGAAVTPESLSKEISKCSLIVDFSTEEANALLLSIANQNKSKLFLIGTTGMARAQSQEWEKVAKKNNHRVLMAPNTSIGIMAMRSVLSGYSQALMKLGFKSELIEIHHEHKRDAPSGTAKLLTKAILANRGKNDRIGNKQSEITIHSIRGGGNFGEHQVIFLGQHEELRFEHRALSRALFADGARRLADWLGTKSPGYYEIEDVDLFST